MMTSPSHFAERDSTKSGSSPRAFSLARIVLAVLLVAAPLPYGSVYAWAWASLTVLTLLVVLLWTVGSVREGRLRIGYTPLFVPLFLLLALGATQLFFHLTLTPFATREALVKLGTYCALYFIVIQLFAAAPVETWRRIGIGVLVFSFAFSFLSILQFFWNPARIVWLGRDLAAAPFGSYVDRDHYAGLMEMVIPLSAAYVLSRPKRDPLNVLLWFGVLVPIVSLLLTASRGGFISILAETAILGWITIYRSPLPGRRLRIAATGLALVAVAGLFFWLAPEFVRAKIGTINNYLPQARGESRPTLWKNSLGIFREHPLVGAGMGSFVTVYPAHQTEAIDLITEHAHNDYVEALTETGVLGGVLILVELVLFIGSAFRNLARQLESESGWMQLGAAIACAGLLVHSIVDFNLRMPANGAWFAFCAGLASLSGLASLRVNSRPQPGPRLADN